jgi:hypothetical protein
MGTIATTTTIAVLGANGVPLPTTTAVPSISKSVVPTTVPVRVKNSPLLPARNPGPVAAKVATGELAVHIDGVKTEAKVTRENNQIIVTAGSLRATVSGADESGKTSPLDDDGNIHLDAGDVIRIGVGGFKPDSNAEVWLFSTPTQLGEARVGKAGAMQGEYKLPLGIDAGSHRIVVSAKLPNGKPTTFTLGILVGDMSTTTTLTWVLIAIPITVAIGFGFLLPTQLRRRRLRNI